MSTAMPFAASWRKVLLGALAGGLVVISTPAVSHLPDIANVPTLAPLVREITPSVVNISVHGHVKEENPLYRDPLFREFFCPEAIGTRISSGRLGRHRGCSAWIHLDGQSQ
jgi:hypothetical protein